LTSIVGKKNTMDVNGAHQLFAYRHSICVQKKKKEIHTGLKQLEVE